MLSFDTRASLIEALTLPLEPELHDLLTARITDAIDRGLGDMTHILVVQAGDTEADIIDAIGFSPLVHRIYGTRFGDSDHEPDWDWRELHDGWTELLYIVDGSSFAYLLFIREVDGMQQELRAMWNNML